MESKLMAIKKNNTTTKRNEEESRLHTWVLPAERVVAPEGIEQPQAWGGPVGGWWRGESEGGGAIASENREKVEPLGGLVAQHKPRGGRHWRVPG